MFQNQQSRITPIPRVMASELRGAVVTSNSPIRTKAVSRGARADQTAFGLPPPTPTPMRSDLTPAISGTYGRILVRPRDRGAASGRPSHTRTRSASAPSSDKILISRSVRANTQIKYTNYTSRGEGRVMSAGLRACLRTCPPIGTIPPTVDIQCTIQVPKNLYT